jgi:peptidoglycan/LPS O-acetylase OafA/YrhL
VTPSARTFEHRNDIDGLRAIAVIAVIVHHASAPALPGGFIGVDVFFVISGFLITSIILRDLDAGTFSFAAFYERRARRLFPNLTLLLVFCSCVAWVLLLPADFLDYSKSLFSTSIFASNMFFWRDAWYFAAPSQTKPLLHTWSLAIEEQYYLLFPAVLWTLHRYAKERIRAACVIGFVVSLAMSVWAVSNTPAAAFYVLPSRAWELLLGSLLVVGTVPTIRSTRLADVIALAGLVAILGAAIGFDSATPFPGLAALVPCTGTAMVICAGFAPGASAVKRLLGWRPLVLIGLMSYSLYLWHWPLLAFARYFFLSGLTAGATALCIVISLGVAYFAWRFVERPVRSRALLPKRRDLVVVCAASAVVLLLFADAGERSAGQPQRFGHVPIIDYDSVVADLGRDPAGCFVQASRHASWNAAACTYVPSAGGTGARSRRLFLIGDSFAAQFSGWLKSNFPGTMVELTSASCPPLFDFTHDVHTRWCSEINVAREAALRSEHFTDVFLGAWWGQTQNSGVMSALERTVHDILDAGVAHVVVLGTVPHFRDSPIDIENRRQVFGRPGADSLETAANAAYRATLERLSRLKRVTILNVDDLLCRDGKCPYMHHGQMLYVDGAAHLTRAGVQYVMAQADWMGVGTSPWPATRR